eukprot:COSAG05_NODE_8408_length_706_cov_1.586491_1_plen_164_part_10
MGILYCGDRPLTHGGAGIAGLRSSVGALRADNARLEALLGEFLAAPAPAAPPHAEKQGQHAASPPGPELGLSPVRVAPLPAAPRRRIGKGGYAFSLRGGWHRWATHMIDSGIVAPRSGFVQYWAQWSMHALAYYFHRLQAYGKLHALKATAWRFVAANALRRWQ